MELLPSLSIGAPPPIRDSSNLQTKSRETSSAQHASANTLSPSAQPRSLETSPISRLLFAIRAPSFITVHFFFPFPPNIGPTNAHIETETIAKAACRPVSEVGAPVKNTQTLPIHYGIFRAQKKKPISRPRLSPPLAG